MRFRAIYTLCLAMIAGRLLAHSGISVVGRA